MAQRYKVRLGDGTVLSVDSDGLRTWAGDARATAQAIGSWRWQPLQEVLAEEEAAARLSRALVPPQPREEATPPEFDLGDLLARARAASKPTLQALADDPMSAGEPGRAAAAGPDDLPVIPMKPPDDEPAFESAWSESGEPEDDEPAEDRAPPGPARRASLDRAREGRRPAEPHPESPGAARGPPDGPEGPAREEPEPGTVSRKRLRRGDAVGPGARGGPRSLARRGATRKRTGRTTARRSARGSPAGCGASARACAARPRRSRLARTEPEPAVVRTPPAPPWSRRSRLPRPRHRAPGAALPRVARAA